jgi:hypothetical protein
MPDATPVLASADAKWLDWTITQISGSCVPEEHIGPDEAVKPIVGGGCSRVDRQGRTTTFILPEPRPADLIVHPMLSFTAVVAARWSGAQSFHAGAFVVDGGAWGVLGRKGAGKSTLLAAIAARGYPVVCDDVLVVRGPNCLAGPRAVDLREDTAAQFPDASFRGVVNGRQRWRLLLSEIAPEIPVHGWVVLEWGSDRVAAVGPGERFGLLAESLAVRLPPPNPAALFELARLPMLSVARMRDIQLLDSFIDGVADAVRSARGASCG